MFAKMKVLEKKVNFQILSIFKGAGKKLQRVTFLSKLNFTLIFNYIDTSNISIFLS